MKTICYKCFEVRELKNLHDVCKHCMLNEKKAKEAKKENIFITFIKLLLWQI